MNDNLDERKSGSTSRHLCKMTTATTIETSILPLDFLNENNNCNNSSICIHQGEGDNKIGDFNIDIS
ncbi:MAG: hypothetical protein M3251_04920 [Thermoproteota archaeon]|nr:hypothetical protein [Thermoproteota archaeon]